MRFFLKKKTSGYYLQVASSARRGVDKLAPLEALKFQDNDERWSIFALRADTGFHLWNKQTHWLARRKIYGPMTNANEVWG